METIGRPSRRTILLNACDLRELSALHASAVHLMVLSNLVGMQLSEASSEAEVLHAVWSVGIQAVREGVEDAGYAAMEAEGSPVDRKARKAVARRRRPAWADER